MRNRLASLWLVSALLLILAPFAMASTTWYVDGVNGNDNNDCKTPQTACKTIGHAISLTANGDTISVAAATYMENIDINHALRILGSGADTTIIHGTGGTVVKISPGHVVTLSGLTIRNGNTGIDNSGRLDLESSVVTENTSHPGCALYCFSTGAGISNHTGATLYIRNSTVSANIVSLDCSSHTRLCALGGGGIFSNGSRLTIINTTISGNAAKRNGGIGGTGGGIWVAAGTAIISNSTIAKNMAGGGAAIENAGTLIISNTTIARNTSTSGSISDYPVATATLQNTIISNNAGGNCSGTMTSNGYNLSSDGSCNFNGPGDLNNIDPKLGPLQNNGGPTKTMALRFASPAIDAGNPNGCRDNLGILIKTDQRGMPRHDKEDTGGCDIGAYESQSD